MGSLANQVEGISALAKIAKHLLVECNSERSMVLAGPISANGSGNCTVASVSNLAIWTTALIIAVVAVQNAWGKSEACRKAVGVAMVFASPLPLCNAFIGRHHISTTIASLLATLVAGSTGARLLANGFIAKSAQLLYPPRLQGRDLTRVLTVLGFGIISFVIAINAAN